MNWRDRKVRIAIVTAFAVMTGFVAWRTGGLEPSKERACVALREEVTDASGKVVGIKRRSCK